MAISTTNLVPLLAFTTIFLMLLNGVNSANSVSFTFDKFDPDQDDLILQGDATINPTSHVLELSKSDSVSVGRALYSAPIRLWKSSALVASFETTFTFVISTSNTPGDGLTFFLAPTDSTIPPGSNGGLFGLFTSPSSNALNNNTLKHTVDDFKASTGKAVAVEFDTYINPGYGDPNYKHIGIDINSVKSVVTNKWNWENGATATVDISYNSVSRTLAAVATYPNSQPVSVSYVIDLNTVLPEWVRVGFSGSTGAFKETSNIISWSFSASLKSLNAKKEEMDIASVV